MKCCIIRISSGSSLFAIVCISESLVYKGLNRESYTSAHVLLNLLNELGKSDKMQGLQSILSHFRNKFNEFNNTSAQMSDSIYCMTLRLL